MRIVIALGGNALLRRGDPMTTDVQRQNIRIAAEAITPLAAGHSIVVVHGNGPQVGLLSLQAEAYAGAEPYPLDVLDAGTQGMIGYLIQQELRSILPPEQQVATLLTMIVVDPDDPAFARPAKFVGPVYHKDAADALAAKKGWAFRQDGSAWRRVVPSPEPRRIVEIEPISWLLDRGAVVICAGGGGIPTMLPSSGPGALVGVEAVIDKDLASELLAEDVHADLFVMATDADGVYLDWGSPDQRRLGRVTPEELAGYEFAAGSMGPKAEAAARFVAKTGGRAAIGSLADIAGIVAGTAGTNVISLATEQEAQRRWIRPKHLDRHPGNAGKEIPVGAAGRVHRCRGDGGRGDLRAAGRGRRGGRGGGVAVVPDRRGRRGTAGVFVREAGRPVPVGRGTAGVRGEVDRQRPFHRGHLVADLYGQRDRDGDGGGVVREHATSTFAGENQAWIKVFAALIIVVMTALNVAGSGLVASAQTVIVYVVLGILAFFSVVTLVNIHPSLLAFSGYPSFQDIISSVALTFFAFLGFGIITFTAKDLAKPSRQLPKAMFLALGIATVIYVAIALGVFGTLTVDKVISSGGTAIAVAAEPTLGRAGYWLMTVTALFATAGATNAGLYPAQGLSERLAETGQFPPVMARKAGGRASNGLLVQAAVCLVLAVAFNLDSIASIGSAVALVIFTMITAAHLRIRAETGANLLMLILAIVAAGAVFVTFVFTTLIHEPASIITLAGILVLSVALDYGWKHFRDTRTKNVQLAH